MKSTRHILLVLILIGANISCTHVSVTKIQENNQTEQGLRYSLPKPYLVATPLADGTVDFKFEYFPDDNNTYAVDSWSFIAKHDLTVSVEHGLLKKVTWNGDNSQVAAAMTESAGAVTKQLLENKIEADKAAAAAKAENEKVQAADEVARKAEVEKARQELLAAIEKLETAKKGGVKDDALSAMTEKVNAAEKNYTDKNSPPTVFSSVRGPVFYKIDENKNDVKLIAVDQQGIERQPFYNTTIIKPAETPQKLAFYPKGTITPTRPGKGKPYEFAIYPTQSLDETIPLQWECTDEKSNKIDSPNLPSIAVCNLGNKIQVVLDKKIYKVGKKYTLHLVDKNVSFDFKIIK